MKRRPSKTLQRDVDQSRQEVTRDLNDKYKALYPGKPLDFSIPLPPLFF